MLALSQLVLGRIVAGVPERGMSDCFGHISLSSEMMWIVVWVFITFVVTEVAHQFGWCIAQVKRNGLIAGFLNKFERSIDCKVSRVAFRGCGQI